ncbi:acyltransferase family protein [Variovorax sp. AFSI2.2]|uniref:acyltransferase family protein n=1 Tax=Variovorax sp. AFSI2.2 TaxID=3384160 RepID=UPI003EC0B4E3
MTTTSSPTSPQEHAHLVHPKYRPDIDGLRAVAVLSVLGYHAFPQWIKGGFIGVDIFFVISGFLITTIILGSFEGDGFSYREFYARRVKRIFPALVLVLAATFAFGWYALLPHEWEQLGKHVAAGAGFVSNFAFWSEAGYFDNAAETKPLLHLWSLAIEEQFYIFWPVLLGLAWKRKWRVLAVVGAVAALSFLLNVSTIHSHRTAAFYSPLSRFWELMIGGMLAYMRLHRPLPKPGWGRHAQSIAGLVLIGLGLAYIRGNKAFPGFWAILPTLGAFYCIAAGPTGVLNRYVLASRPMVWIGLISYPLYLWHWPLLVFARIVEGGLPSEALRAFLLATAVLLAWITYRFVERPARASSAPRMVRTLGAAVACLAVLGVFALTSRLTGRLDDSYFDTVEAARKNWVFGEGLTPAKLKSGQTVFRVGSGKERVLIMGDSHVQQYAIRAAQLAKDPAQQLNSITFATAPGCPFVPGIFRDATPGCDELRTAFIDYALTDDVDTVVIGGCWNCYFMDQAQPATGALSEEGFYFRAGPQKLLFREGSGVDASLASLEILLKRIASRKKVYLLLDNPIGLEFSPEHLISGHRLGTMHVGRMTPHIALRTTQNNLNQRMAEIANSSGASIVDPLPFLCPENHCIRALADGTPVYKDRDHFRSDYARTLPYLDDILLERHGR